MAPSERQAYLARMDSENFQRLRVVANVSGTSVNSLINEAVATYLESPQVRDLVAEAHARNAETIRQLGGPPS